MSTVKHVEQELRSEMQNLSFDQLLEYARDMGVQVGQISEREEIEELCINMELHCFTH